MADHTDEQIDAMVEIAVKSRGMAEMHVEWLSANDNDENMKPDMPLLPIQFPAAAAE
jgi:hypothetical protein